MPNSESNIETANPKWKQRIKIMLLASSFFNLDSSFLIVIDWLAFRFIVVEFRFVVSKFGFVVLNVDSSFSFWICHFEFRFLRI